MNERDATIREAIHRVLQAAARLRKRNLFGGRNDRLSVRIPGTSQFVWLHPDESVPARCSFHERSIISQVHGRIYTQRRDAGAILQSTTPWSRQLAQIGVAPPILFDEAARHIGSVAFPVIDGNDDSLAAALVTGSNVAVFGQQLIRIGMTADRLVFNAELYEKCAMAFVVAHSSDQPIRTIPWWVRLIAGNRLRKDQTAAAAAMDQGQFPEEVNAY